MIGAMKIDLFAFLVILMLAPALAQMYQWQDDQGTVHFTNELQSIPEPYRSQARFLPASPMAPPFWLAPGLTAVARSLSFWTSERTGLSWRRRRAPATGDLDRQRPSRRDQRGDGAE